MTGKEWDISDQELVEILWREFAVEIDSSPRRLRSTAP